MGGDDGADDLAATPPADLVEGEQLFWKMADVKGFFKRHLVTGYLITNYRCFVWDAEQNAIRASVPVSMCETVVSFMRRGRRSRRGGRFVQPPPPSPDQEATGEDQLIDVGDVSFRVDDKTVMVFREVSDPEGVKRLVDALRARGDSPADSRVSSVIVPRRGDSPVMRER